ncbi:MAG: hypothetical protein H7336_14545 [Bacteriovorax sp.]|nr:hypothetical protein [Bacteriovorax sp.]
MNGISSTLKEEIKKSGDRKHKEKFKFIAAIIMTNIMVALLCFPMRETRIAPASSQKTIHTDYQMMVVPLNALITENNLTDLETPVSLISKDKKMVVEKAWLHESVKSENGITQFKIEINNREVVKVSEYVDTGMVAVPYVETKKLKVALKKGSKYEVSI